MGYFPVTHGVTNIVVKM